MKLVLAALDQYQRCFRSGSIPYCRVQEEGLNALDVIFTRNTQLDPDLASLCQRLIDYGRNRQVWPEPHDLSHGRAAHFVSLHIDNVNQRIGT